mgnify:CR=1 FL=1
MRGKNAVVTGSTSGIGQAIANALAGAGANVTLNGLGDAVTIEAERAALASRTGVNVAFDGADMTKPDQIEALIRNAEDRFGSVDILVNNAGIQHTALIEDFPVETWDAIIAINLSSSFHTMRAALPGMKAKGWGRVVNIASVHGLVASVEKAAYIAAKHGLVGMSKVAALEAAGTGVTCNTICPGFVKTPLVMAQIHARAERDGLSEDEAVRSLLGEKQPSMTFTTVEQIGQAAVFLCSDAAANMTGTQLTLDGGWTAQ